MIKQVIFVIEPERKTDSDGIYIMEILNYYYPKVLKDKKRLSSVNPEINGSSNILIILDKIFKNQEDNLFIKVK